jgi:hypothetical protein
VNEEEKKRGWRERKTPSEPVRKRATKAAPLCFANSAALRTRSAGYAIRIGLEEAVAVDADGALVEKNREDKEEEGEKEVKEKDLVKFTLDALRARAEMMELWLKRRIFETAPKLPKFENQSI